jgi:hypothetical protein
MMAWAFPPTRRLRPAIAGRTVRRWPVGHGVIAAAITDAIACPCRTGMARATNRRLP